tara:strand:+ start:395 stop:595 length:201 start_codon:yes stop_codon:yes gene_type:complete
MHNEQEETTAKGVLVDFTSFKLKNMAEREQNPIDADLLLSLLDLYEIGVISITWESGYPMADVTEN